MPILKINPELLKYLKMLQYGIDHLFEIQPVSILENLLGFSSKHWNENLPEIALVLKQI